MDQKTKELVETAKQFVLGRILHGPGETVALVDRLRIAVLEQDKRARHAEHERDLYDKRITELESENAIWRKDVEDAAGELLVSIPQPGTEAAKMLLANRAMIRELHVQKERVASIDESNATLSRKLGGLSEMLAAYGLPSDPKALAGAIQRERTWSSSLLENTITNDVVPTNENFVRVAMAEHCAPSVMDERYIKEWSRRFGPALDIIRARVAFKVNELDVKLVEAIDLAGEAIPYVSDYFRGKYEMDERLAKLLPIIVQIKDDEIKTRVASSKTVG